jgi:hypothetical protein
MCKTTSIIINGILSIIWSSGSSVISIPFTASVYYLYTMYIWFAIATTISPYLTFNATLPTSGLFIHRLFLDDIIVAPFVECFS